MLINSHCHLDYFTPAELPGVLERAAEAGVGEMVTIGTTLAQSASCRRWPRRAERLVHGRRPSAPRRRSAVPAPEEIAALADHPKVIGIGESGLDYFYDRAPRDVQQAVFRAHIRAARLAGLPLAIHARDADDDIARSCRKNATRRGVRLPAALLQFVPPAGGGGRGAGRVHQFLGHPDLPEIQ